MSAWVVAHLHNIHTSYTAIRHTRAYSSYVRIIIHSRNLIFNYPNWMIYLHHLLTHQRLTVFRYVRSEALFVAKAFTYT